MGSIVSLQDGLYQYELPEVPPIEDVWYYEIRDKKLQYWRTPHNQNHKWLTPKGELWNVKQMTEKDRREYIEYWRDKWLNGLWFFCNGEPTYMTGGQVDHLIFNKFKSRHFIYLDAQRERFYFRDLTNNDRLCDGRLWAKGRRVGITAEQVTENIRCILSDDANHTALQSDVQNKTKSTLLNPIIDVYIKRPIWMREAFYSSNGKIPRSSLELKDVVIRTDDDHPLGGSVRGFPTTSKALDGEEFMLDTMDEVSKWTETLPYETFEVNKKTIINPGKRGKMDLLSTTGDSKEAAKAVRDWHRLIADSNPKIRNGNGQTNTGLYPWFVSYIHSLELLERFPQIKDIYGKINREMAEEFIWNDVKRHPKDSKEYIYALYKMPMEMRHVLLTPTSQGYFSKIRLSARLEELRGLPNDHRPYVRGRLEEDQHGKVYFEADEYGHWYIAVHPYFSVERGIDTRNRFRRSLEGVYFPPVNPEGAIGYDPIRYKKEDTSSNNLSRAAIIVHQKFDYFGSGNANKYCGLYLNRPDDPRDAHKECIKGCKYWGYPAMHERVIETVKEDFEDANMIPFLLKNPKDKLHGMWIDSQGKVVKNGTDWMVSRFAPPQNELDIDQIANFPFIPPLEDLDGFDIGNTTAFDCYMAMLELEYGLKQIEYTNVTDNFNNNVLKAMMEIMPKRN